MDYKKRFLNYLKAEKIRIFIIVILVLIFVIAQLSQPFLIGKILDFALTKNSTKFIGFIIAASCLALIGVTAGYFFEYNAGVLTQNITKKIRNDIYRKMLSISVQDITNQTKGSLIQLEIGDIENISNGMISIFKSFIEGTLSIIITIVLMFYINWILAIGVIILSPLSVIASRFIAKHSHKYFKEQAKLQADLNSFCSENISNSQLIQSFNYQKETQKQFEKKNQNLYEHNRLALFSASWINPTTRFVNNIIYAVIGVFGIVLFILTSNGDKTLLSLNATLTLGSLGSFLSYTNQYTKPFNEISSVVSEFETALFSLKRVNDFLNKDDEVNVGVIKMKNIEEIDFSNMSFSYDKNKQLIKDFNLKIKKGQKVAIVGPTGAGKTTLINVLLNFYSPIGGDILYNHISQHKIEKASLRNNFGMVLQDTWIFNDTVLENVRYAKEDASDLEVVEACKKAHADSFIKALPNGYQTFISSKEGLSDGEKQMLMIARVMLLKPDIVILDEATSNVDSRNEKLINDAFDQMTDKHTSIVIAHRLSTIQSADTILVLNNGQIIEIGNHASLMKKKGFYYSMYSTQYAKKLS